jgi:hypothetical protein
VRLVGPRAKAARPAVEAVDDGGPQVRVVEGGDGSPARIVITLAGNRVGVRAGRIQIRTGLAEPELLSLPYWLSVRGALAVSPTNPYFNLRDPEARRQLLTVTSARAGFRLFAASVDGPFLASFKRVAGSAAYAVSVSVDERRVPADVRGVTGRLVLVSNDPAEPRKEIPLFGMGAVVGP